MQSLLLLSVVGLFLAGVIWAGRWGLDQLRGNPRYDITFGEIECETPVGMTKQDFLEEVQFVAHLPEKLNVLDEGLTKKLRDGFAKHRWVAQVDAVDVTPPKHVAVKLRFRVPVLAVKVGDGLRAVDSNGVLLHTDAPTQGLPVFEGAAKPPPARAGVPWGDPKVEAAARRLKKSP
ncbi:MAG: hypothetical protein FJ303_22120 [Planctomycetes bacterium]|nr:hypothetical protein [Planctomycetota bacterium]